MKKIVIGIVIIIVVFCSLWYKYYQYKAKKSEIDTHNIEYDSLYEKEINGNNLATLINKTIDSNEKNNIKKNENGQYIDNDRNSIRIEIKFKQSPKIFPIEIIYLNQVTEFIRLYGQAMFKCSKIEYHNSTKFVKYIFFEEV